MDIRKVVVVFTRKHPLAPSTDAEGSHFLHFGGRGNLDFGVVRTWTLGGLGLDFEVGRWKPGLWGSWETCLPPSSM